MITFTTRTSSVYEIDPLLGRVRRLYGINPPTEGQGPDRVWKTYSSVAPWWGGLCFQWGPEPGPKDTITSQIIDADRARVFEAIA